MIIGTGLLARSFSRRYQQSRDVIIFASGVSNSTEQSDEAFTRERELVMRAISEHGHCSSFVYFSSCGVTSNQQTKYIEHKRAMEMLVATHPGGLILRLPQVVGPSSNPHTLTNFLANEILAGHPISVWRYAERNLIDIDDIVLIATEIIERRSEYPACVAVASPHTLSMPALVEKFEKVLGKKALMSVVGKGESLSIDTSTCTRIAHRLNIEFGPNYVDNLLHKYYGSPENA